MSGKGRGGGEPRAPREPKAGGATGKTKQSGEAETLVGRNLIMGDRAARSKPSDVIPSKKAAKDSKSSVIQSGKQAKGVRPAGGQERSLIDADIREEGAIYVPQLKEDRSKYEEILRVVGKLCGDIPHETLVEVVNEALAVLKSDGLSADLKKKEIQAMFKADDKDFDRLVLLAKEIKDYRLGLQVGKKSGLDQATITTLDPDKLGAVEDEEEEGLKMDPQAEAVDYGEMPAPEFEDDEGSNAAEQDQVAKEEEVVELAQVDGEWLANQLGSRLGSPEEGKRREELILIALGLEDESESQNRLIELFEPALFEFASALHAVRFEVFLLTKLGQAAPNKRNQILDELLNSENRRLAYHRIKSLLGESDPNKLGTKHTENTREEAIARLKDGQNENESAEVLARLPKTVLDLSLLEFSEAGRFMGNEKCTLPKGSVMKSMPGYEEVVIPAPPRKDLHVPLRKISEIPSWARSAFPRIQELNPIQSTVYDCAFRSANNMLVCAPTGAGKTNIALMTILQQIGENMDDQGHIDTSRFKVVYIAPMKALVSEIVNSLKERLSSRLSILTPGFRVSVREMTGDMQLSRAEVEETSVIVATPEKWDIATRKAGDKYFLELVTLLIIDEVHLLHDGRGPVLEAIVARTLRFCENSGQQIRLVGLSATLPNYQDVGLFLRVNAAEKITGKENGLFFFDSGYRPIPLEQQYLGVTDDKGVKRLLLMKELLYAKVIERVSRQQILVFVHSRRETVKTADELREQALIQDQLGKFVRDDDSTKTILSEVAGKFTSAELRRLVPFGIAVHHAGLARGDRELVEALFADKRIQVLISTATLAWGVNLPAKTVIIKGTQVYSPEKGKWVELSPQDLLQMLGRAGRPGFDSSGEGLILTSYKELKYYLSLVNSQLPIESQFISQLADQLNAEIVLGSISNLSEAVKWLSYTYLYVRMLISPKIYGISVDEFEADRALVQRRVNLVHSAAALLDKNCLIRYNRATGEFQSTTLGRIASHYYIKQASMAVYAEHIKPNITMIDLFRIFSLSAEFQHIPVRDEEKSEMEKLLGTVPVPVRTAREDPASKVNVLLQSYISRKKLEGYAINSDMVYVTQSAARIMRGLFEVFLKRGWASVAENCLRLCLMVDRQQWSCMSPLRQYTNLREEILRRMENQEHLTWDHFCSMTAAQVGNVIRHEREGPNVHKLIHQFPRLELDALVQPISRSTIRVELKITSNFEWDTQVSGRREPFWILVTDVDNELLLHHEFFTLTRDEYKETRQFEFSVPLLEPLNPHYFVKVVSDRWLQCQAEIPISFKNLILPSRFPQPAELSDKSLILREHFDDPRIRQLLEDFRIRTLNPVQTECYAAISSGSDNYLLCAPGNSGKMVSFILGAAQLFLRRGAETKILVVVPLKSQIPKRREALRRLALVFNVQLSVLTGQTTPDLEAVANSQIVLTTAANWDNISRRWRKRSHILLFDLVLLDQIHLVDAPGAAYEVVASRVRYIAATLAADEESPHTTRIAVHGACIANARDVAEWLGVQPESTFNFSPKVRPIPLETAITAFEQHDAYVRFFAMTRQLAQDLIRTTRKRESVLVFVSDKQSARLGAAHLLNYAQSRAKEVFLSADSAEAAKTLKAGIEEVKLKDLQLLLESGIGYLYDGMGEAHVVERLFRRGLLGVVFVPHSMVYATDLQAHTVVILDCKHTHEQRLVDYTPADLQAMVARAGRPGVDLSCHSIVYVPGPSKESIKKSLTDSIPVESRLHQHLAEHVNAEVFSETLDTKQDCLDWLAWSLFFRRVRQNPNFYGLVSTGDLQLSAHLSELVETALEELVQLDCVRVEPSEEGDPTKDKLVLTNGGTVAATYYINTYTVGLFNTFLKEHSKLKDILSQLSAATEFEDVPVRPGEPMRIKQLYTEIKFKPEKPSFSDPSLKAQVLLQTHFERKVLPSEFRADREKTVTLAVRLIHAMVYCLGDKAWLKPAMLAMKLCQMVVQAMWSTDSALLQLPYVNSDIVKRLSKPEYTIDGQIKAVTDIETFCQLDEDVMQRVLGVKSDKLADVAAAANRYPNIKLEAALTGEDTSTGDVEVEVNIERLGFEEEETLGPVISGHYPETKQEYWWVVIGDSDKNLLFRLKRVEFLGSWTSKLSFKITDPGQYKLTVYLICDSYIGCDSFSDPLPVTVEAEQAEN